MQHLNFTVAGIIFTLSSAIGLSYSVGILPRYLSTYRAALRLQDPENRRIAEGIHFEIVANETIRGLIHLTFLIAGIWSIWIEPAPVFFTDHNHVLFSLFLLWSLVFANIGITVNTLIVRRGYRKRRNEGTVKLLPTRDTMATVLRRLRRLEQRVVVEERRNATIEATATIAHERANVAETRADAAHLRADASDIDLADHEIRIEQVEEVTEVKRTVRKRTEEP